MCGGGRAVSDGVCWGWGKETIKISTQTLLPHQLATPSAPPFTPQPTATQPTATNTAQTAGPIRFVSPFGPDCQIKIQAHAATLHKIPFLIRISRTLLPGPCVKQE